jgi:glycosyltransferase involved in cell wall biosynthesis
LKTSITSKPLVSTIIIFLNEERFLQEAIASVFAQSYVDWELLLVDDGSTDGSTVIAKRLASEYPQRVRYLHHNGHANRGMSASRNLGLEHARGAFVAFLDADDVWLPHKLTEQVELLQSNPRAAMVYGRTQYWHSWTGRKEDRDLDELTKGGAHVGTIVEPPDLLTAFLRDGDIYPCMCSVIIRKEVFDQVGSFEERFRNANEDMVFHTKVFLNHPVYVADKCWDRYRIHSDSFWNVARTSGWHVFPGHTHPAHEEYLVWVEAYLQERAIDDQDLQRAFRKALWPYRHPRSYHLWRKATGAANRLVAVSSRAFQRIHRS